MLRRFKRHAANVDIVPSPIKDSDPPKWSVPPSRVSQTAADNKKCERELKSVGTSSSKSSVSVFTPTLETKTVLTADALSTPSTEPLSRNQRKKLQRQKTRDISTRMCLRQTEEDGIIGQNSSEDYIVTRHSDTCADECLVWRRMNGQFFCRHMYTCTCMSYLLEPYYYLCKHICRVVFLSSSSSHSTAGSSILPKSYVAAHTDVNPSLESMRDTVKHALDKKKEESERSYNLVASELPSMTEAQLQRLLQELNPILHIIISEDKVVQRTVREITQNSSQLTGFVEGGTTRGGIEPPNHFGQWATRPRQRQKKDTVATAPNREEISMYKQFLQQHALIKTLEKGSNLMCRCNECSCVQGKDLWSQCRQPSPTSLPSHRFRCQIRYQIQSLWCFLPYHVLLPHRQQHNLRKWMCRSQLTCHCHVIPCRMFWRSADVTSATHCRIQPVFSHILGLT